MIKVGGLVYVICDLLVRPLVKVKLEALGKASKRRKYSDHEIAAVVATSEAVGVETTVRELKRKGGFNSIDKRTIERWQQPKVQKQMGRPSCADFRDEVFDQLVFTSVETAHTAERQVTVAVNVIYSYSVVEQAARLVHALPKWSSNPLVVKLKFSKPWVHDFLEKYNLRRRRITNIEKVLPPPEQVQATLEGIQKDLREYELEEVGNADESGIFYGEKPKNQYVPKDATRASTPETDDKARFTAMLFGDAKGKMGTVFLIIKCSPTKPDLLSTCVVQNLHRQEGFTAADGWQLKQWSRSLTLKNKKHQLVTSEYKRHYLIHDRGHVITCQAKAWMDSAGIAMWVDTVLGPHAASLPRKRFALTWDNCSSHNSDAVQAVFQEHNIYTTSRP